MRRIPEFVLALIGSILALIVSAYWFYLFGCIPATNQVANAGFMSNGIGVVLAIISIVFAALIEKKTKVSSIILIIMAVVLLITNFFQALSATLLLIAGIMGLARKVN